MGGLRLKLKSITGPELKAIRRKAGINQTEMGKLTGFSRHAVSYWETKTRDITWRDCRNSCPEGMLRVLGISLLPNFTRPVRAREDRVLRFRTAWQQALDREADRRFAHLREKQTPQRQLCGAKTRKGRPCRLKSEPGKRRCKFHGGMSTGPKTAAGKARISEAQKRRWAAYRARGELTQESPMKSKAVPVFCNEENQDA